MRKLLLAHDLGTSSNKACLFDASGALLASAYAPYNTFYEQAGRVEQCVQEWYDAFFISTREVIAAADASPDEIAAISFSSQGLACVLLDHDGKLLDGRSMIWMDGRSREEASFIEEHYGKNHHNSTTGNGMELALYPCSKLMWLRNHRPEVYGRIHKVLGVKEYIIYRLTGEYGLNDYTEAQVSGLFNLGERQYDQELLELTQIPRNILCDPVDSATVVGTVRADVAQALGVSPRTKVILGMVDNPSSLIGAGGMQSGTTVASFGTATWVAATTKAICTSKDYRANPAYIGAGRYQVSANSHAAGAAMDWALENILKVDGGTDKYNAAESLAQSVAPGADNLLFLPAFLNGNARYSNSNLAGSLVGMRLHHTKAHIARAIYESKGFELLLMKDYLSEVEVRTERLQAIGGGASSMLQRQILADMYGMSVGVPCYAQHTAALGAVIHAAIGVGVLSGYGDAAYLFPSQNVIEPNLKNNKVYIELFGCYKCFYEQLISAYDRLGNVRTHIDQN